MRKLVSGILKSLGLLGLARASKRYLSSFPKNIKWRIKGDFTSDKGLPLPPPGLSFEVSANYDIEYFLRTGSQGADSIREILLRNNHPISSFKNILDFGCGCGRITRHWKDLTKTSITGTDINPRLVR